MSSSVRVGAVAHRLAHCLALCLATFTWQLSLAQTSPAAPNAPGTTSPPDQTLIIRAAALIDGTTPQPRANQEILIHGDRIVAVYAAGTKSVPPLPPNAHSTRVSPRSAMSRPRAPAMAMLASRRP
jgi:hypothetical protein